MLRVDAHGENEGPLRERALRQRRECVEVRRTERVILARRPRQDRNDPAGVGARGVVHHEDARAATHLAKRRIADEAGPRVVQPQPAEDPGRAARGKPLLHVGPLEPLSGGVGGIAPGRLHGDQKHGLRLAGRFGGGGIVVAHLHRAAGIRLSLGDRRRGRGRALGGGREKRIDDHGGDRARHERHSQDRTNIVSTHDAGFSLA